MVFQKTNNEVLYFDYDENGQVITAQYYNNSTNEYKSYIYIKNLQGDIIEILDEQFNLVVKYNYDGWGNVLSVTDANGTQITDQNHIGNMNPFRYRGYYYDTETGLYYLQNRYYNPEWGRFLNADGILNDTTLGKNLYAYCDNNPINNADNEGTFAITISVTVSSMLLVGFKAALYAVATYATVIATNKVIKKVENKPKREEKSHTVYELKKEKSEKIVYVGRTVNKDARKAYHQKTKPGNEFIVVKEGLTKEEARGLEQILIIQYSTKEQLNKINGINPNNRNLGVYMRAGGKIAIDLLKSELRDEALYWMYEKWR